jgi:hypothetical protein
MAQELKKKSSPELDPNKSREADQINASDVKENHLTPQKNQDFDAVRSLQEGDKSSRRGETQGGELDMIKDFAQSHYEARKQENSGKNSLEEPKTKEEENFHSSSIKDAVIYNIMNLVDTVEVGVKVIAQDAVKDFGGETGASSNSNFSPADMLALRRGMDQGKLTSGMDQEKLTSEMDQERLTSENK